MPAIRLPYRGEHPPQKPFVGTPVNWAHPLARGLLLSCALNEDAGKTILDSVSGRQFAITGAGWEGGEFSLRAATGRVDISGLPCAINATSKWSLVIRSRGQANSGVATPAVFASFNFDAGVNYWALAVQQYSNYLYFRGRFNNYGDFCAGSHLQAGPHYLDVPETIVLVVSGYTATVYRSDGQSYSAQLGASSDVSAGTITVGNTSGNTVYRRSIGLVQFYNRAITPDEAESILANPWQVYQPPRRLGPAVGGGGTSVSVAHDLRAAISTSVSTAHDTTLAVSTALASVADAVARVSTAIAGAHDTRTAASTTRSTGHDARAVIASSLAFAHDTRVAVATAIESLVDTLANVATLTGSITATHDTRVVVATARATLHDAMAFVATGRTTTHDLRAAVAATVAAIHDTVALVARGIARHHDTRAEVLTQLLRATDTLAAISSHLQRAHDTRAVVQLLSEAAIVIRLAATLTHPSIDIAVAHPRLDITLN